MRYFNIELVVFVDLLFADLLIFMEVLCVNTLFPFDAFTHR
jgi:hypothetical protein